MSDVAKINLLKKEWTSGRQLKKLELLAKVVLFLSVGSFLLQVLYVTGRLVYLRTMISKTKNETTALVNLFNKNKVLVENYVWAQGVLEKIGIEDEKEYKYKDYLLEINSWLTEGTSLVGATFTKKDEITFLVFAKGIDEYRNFETSLNLKQEEEGFGFSEIRQESLVRAEDGTYKIKIILTME
jgi:hypothetical protein